MIRLDDAAQATVRPMPDDWAPVLQDLGVVLRWEGRADLNGVTIGLEVGLRPGPDDDREAAEAELRRAAWVLMELARLGRGDLIAPFRTDRHSSPRRPSRAPKAA